MTAERPQREVRFGLVLNGGVSLAVWIGGVTKEIDALRRASEALWSDDHDRLGPESKTGARYRELLRLLQASVLVDVIAGSSAGGLNGVLLAAAIANGKALPNLRETWITIGDLRTLLRSSTEKDPASLLRGDDVVLPVLSGVLDRLYEGAGEPQQDRLYLYVTATDLTGTGRTFRDSTGRMFCELDPRQRFDFELLARASGKPHAPPPYDLKDKRARSVLARAGRATASFPVAFEPHILRIGERDHRLMDGGVLDNQPFHPVLDRVGVLPAARPVTRVIGYVVPYVNDVGEREGEAGASALGTIWASGSLPRELPKLDSLDRVTRDLVTVQTADRDRDRLVQLACESPKDLAVAAGRLFHAYRETRATESWRVFAAWADPDFEPGGGVLAQDPAIEPQGLPWEPYERTEHLKLREGLWLPPPWWTPTDGVWQAGRQWEWGLGPGERVAILALLSLRDLVGGATAPGEQLLQARTKASRLVWSIREAKIALREAFASTCETLLLPARVTWAYCQIKPRLLQIGDEFHQLDRLIEELNGGQRQIPQIADLVHVEIVQNALSVGDPRVPLPFRFHFMSAGIPNALGHDAENPDTKLAGMKLGHFGGFLKRSWRANDWLWGRLDGVQHVLRAVVDETAIERLGEQRPEELADLAFSGEEDEREAVEEAWQIRLASAPRDDELLHDQDRPIRERFLHVLERARSAPTGEREAYVELVRDAIAARIQLDVLADDLERVAKTVGEDLKAGASGLAAGVAWAEAYARAGPVTEASKRVELFRDLRIGEERPMDEMATRLGLDLGAQTVAVGVGLLSGSRGGLPLAVRGALATLRGLTLATSAVVGVVARSPAVGAAVCALLAAILVWALLAPNALLGALTTTMALLLVVVAAFLFAIATSVLERPLTGRRWLGFLALIAIPLAFAFVAGWPDDQRQRWIETEIGSWATAPVSWWSGSEGAQSWLEEHVGARTLAVAAALAFLAAIVAVVGLRPAFRRWALTWYRVLALLAVISLAIGALARRWNLEGDERDCPDCVDWTHVADERKGMILVGVLLVVFLATTLVVELVVPWWRRRSTASVRPPAI